MRRLTLSVILRVTFGLGETGREFKDAAALSETIGQYLESIVATANEIPPLWSIAPPLSPNYRKVTTDLLPRLRSLVAEVIRERRALGKCQSNSKDMTSVLPGATHAAATAPRNNPVHRSAKRIKGIVLITHFKHVKY